MTANYRPEEWTLPSGEKIVDWIDRVLPDPTLVADVARMEHEVLADGTCSNPACPGRTGHDAPCWGAS